MRLDSGRSEDGVVHAILSHTGNPAISDGPIIGDAETGSFASPPRDGFALNSVRVCGPTRSRRSDIQTCSPALKT